MVENVVLTEAVVSCAFGAVPELHIGIVRIRLSADAALVIIAPLFLLGMDSLPELYGLRPVPGLDLIRFALEIRREEDKEVQ